MTTRIREIRIYKCPCGAVIHDHGVPGCAFREAVKCPRCHKPMASSAATYSISQPDAKNLQLRVARKVV